MLQTQQIKELRLSEKIEEALVLASEDLDKNPDSIYAKRNIFWVYYSFLKKYSSIDNFELFKKTLISIKELQLPESEKMLFDTCVWPINSLLFYLRKNFKNQYSQAYETFKIIKDFNFTKPDKNYSIILNSFYYSLKESEYFVEFIDWWGLENFMPEDYKVENTTVAKMAMADLVYTAYSKKLIEGEKCKLSLSWNKVINKQKIKEFIPKLDIIIEKYPEYIYLPYYKAKFLLALGNENNLLSDFIPFAKKRRNDFWVWDLLADTFQPEDERKIACLCKALSLKTPNEFLINTRQKLTEILIKQNRFQEAKTEIEKILLVRNNNNWNIPNQISEWIKQPWFNNNESNKENTLFYKQYVKVADEILFADTPEETVVIEFVNENKSIINFVKDKSKYGFFSYSGMLEKPEIGDLINVRFNGNSKDGFFRVLSIKKVTSDYECSAIKDFKGNLKINESSNFGFVDDVFIAPNFILKYQINKNDFIKGKAILSFNKKRNEWNWKAVKIY